MEDKNEVIAHGSIPIDNNFIKQWSIVTFLPDDNVEEFVDLIPKIWVSSNNTLCWYPMNHHKSTIDKLAKQCAEVDVKWECFNIQIIEDGIDDYSRGMKMLIKLSKHPNSNLHSDLDERGKGKRSKKPTKRFHEYLSYSENGEDNCRPLQFPRLPLNSRDVDSQQNKENEKRKSISFPKLDKSEHKGTEAAKKILKETCIKENGRNQQLQFIENNRDPPNKHVNNSTENHAAVAESSSRHPGCKMNSKLAHKCAYQSDGNINLQSIGDLLCFLTNEVSSCKITLRKLDKSLESFMENELTIEKPNKQPFEKTTSMMSILSDFPVSTIDELKAIERKLKRDSGFRTEVIEAMHVSSEGDSLQKKINSLLRIIFDDTAASLFNWKGQRGNKEKLEGRRITKFMIEVVTKSFPNVTEKVFGRKAGPWLAQANFRLKNKKHKSDDDIRGEDHSEDDTTSSDDDPTN